MLARFGLNWTDFDCVWAKLDQLWPKSAKQLSMSANFGRHFEKRWTKSAQIGWKPGSNFGAKSMKPGSNGPIRPLLTKVGQTRTGFGRIGHAFQDLWLPACGNHSKKAPGSSWSSTCLRIPAPTPLRRHSPCNRGRGESKRLQSEHLHTHASCCHVAAHCLEALDSASRMAARKRAALGFATTPDSSCTSRALCTATTVTRTHVVMWSEGPAQPSLLDRSSPPGQAAARGVPG